MTELVIKLVDNLCISSILICFNEDSTYTMLCIKASLSFNIRCDDNKCLRVNAETSELL